MKPEPKPVREWLEELPEPYRAAAIRNYDPDFLPELANSIASAVACAFEWEVSPEGYDFWQSFYGSLRTGIALPPYPQPGAGAHPTPNSEEARSKLGIAAGESPYDRAAKEAAGRWAKRDQQQQARIHQLERLAEKRGKELERLRGELDAATEARDHWHRRYFEDRNWRPIETAPKDGTKVLALLRDSNVPHAVFWKQRYGWRIAWDNYDLSDLDGPTHWMPLPEPPASTEGGGE